MTEQKTFKRMTDGKIVLEDVIYDTSVNKKSIILNPQTGNRIDSIRIGETLYYPVGQVKKKNMATNIS
jgi:hypothetical protein